jgi:DNA-directed RNA polymerase subunit alpha
MSESAASTVQDYMQKDALSLEDIDRLRKLVYGSESNRDAMKKVQSKLEKDSSVKRSPAKAYKLALAYWFADRDDEAITLLGKHLKSQEACVTFVRWCLLKGMFSEGYEKAKQGLKKYGDNLELKLLCAQAAVGCGKLKEAETIAAKIEKKLPKLDLETLRSTEDETGSLADAPKAGKAAETTTQPAETPRHPEHSSLFYLQALIEEAKGNWDNAIEFFDNATIADRENILAYFRKAYNLDLRGMDEEAIQTYEEARRLRPLHANILFNLAVLYEDKGKNRKAIQCYKTILEDNPNHERAKLFLSDAEAARYMVYDEEEEKEQDKLMQVLNTPITDFELSVRSRNCLSKMNILTLGNLSKKTEAELLSYKNFGETSFAEIKTLLSAKSLTLGMGSEDFGVGAVEEEIDEEVGVDDDKHDLLDTPLNSVNFSVRCRRAFEKLGILTLSELVAMKESEFSGLRNFGQTSFTELKGKLAEYGLALGPD